MRDISGLIAAVLPAPLHRAGFRLAHALRVRWWRLARPQLTGCRVVAIDADSRVLLVRHSYGHDRWMLPGGGMKRGEDPVAAGARELAEEAGCALHQARVVDVLDATAFGMPNQVHVVVGNAHGAVRADGREITHAEFFAIDALPDHRVDGLAERLAKWVELHRDVPPGGGTDATAG